MDRCCKTCVYSEPHDYLDRFYCHNKDCYRHYNNDFVANFICENWELKEEFKWGKCSECKFGTFDAATNTFSCGSKDERAFKPLVGFDERDNCPFYLSKSSMKPTSVFAESSCQTEKHTPSYADIRNKAYSTLVAEDAIRNKLESVAILDPEFDHFILGNLYQIREDMINLIALTYDIKLDGLKVHSLIALLNKHLKEHPDVTAISDELHEAILALPDE